MRYGGACLLATLGLYLGTLFFQSGTGISYVAGAAMIAFTAYLTWDHLGRGGDPGP